MGPLQCRGPRENAAVVNFFLLFYLISKKKELIFTWNMGPLQHGVSHSCRCCGRAYASDSDDYLYALHMVKFKLYYKIRYIIILHIQSQCSCTGNTALLLVLYSIRPQSGLVQMVICYLNRQILTQFFL